VAGAIAALGVAEAGGAARVVGFDAVLPAVLSAIFPPVFSAVLGTTLRAIGRAFGSGTFDLAAGSFAQAYDPTISTSVVAIAVERNAAKRADRVTAFLFRRITKDQCPSDLVDRICGKNTRYAGKGILCVITAAKSRPGRRKLLFAVQPVGSRRFTAFRQSVIPDMND
jgi:hypothetical protein